MAYRTMVAGTDGSPTATAAVTAAVRLARRCRARLVAISATRSEGFSEAAAREALAAAAEVAAGRRVEAVAELDRSSPAEALLDAARRHDADLIVVGNKGMGAATRFRLGTVPDRVAHEAPCDLLIVDTTGRTGGPAEPGPPYRRIVVGTDGSPTATEAAQRAFDLAALFGAAALLVHVGDPVLGAIRLERTAGLAPDDVEVVPLALEGDPAERIVETAERVGADLVVVGNRGMAGVRRFLGSVPNEVAHRAATDVLVVKTVDRSVEDLGPGRGGLVDAGGRTLAVYVGEDGRTYELSPRCTHMGCTVGWNASDRTWDCPCHGSRFRFDGSVLRGPAVRPLERVGGDAPIGEPEGGPGPSTWPGGGSGPRSPWTGGRTWTWRCR
ncbi:MAG TPA: universal stress protein [Actinomycetota bacterium]|nr:universal stress protein [Actinomycetota bacterium]